MSFGRASDAWISQRKRIVAEVKEKNNGSLEGKWPIADITAGKPRTVYKLQLQYKQLRETLGDPDAAEKKLTAMHFETCKRALDFANMVLPGAGMVLVAWVKYMSLKGRSITQISDLSRRAAACFIRSKGDNSDTKQVVAANVLAREDETDILDLLWPSAPFESKQEYAAFSQTAVDDIATTLCPLSETDIHEMRHTYLPIKREGGLQTKPKSVHSRFASNARENDDTLGLRGWEVDFTAQELETLKGMPTLDAVPRTLRFKCILIMPISYKNRTVQYAEVERASPAFRKKLMDYVERVKGIPPERLVFVDETSIFKDAFLSKGWGPVGGPAVVTVPKSAGARTAVWSAISLEKTHAVILPPTSRAVANLYRSGNIKTPQGMRTLGMLRTHPEYAMPINKYLRATEKSLEDLSNVPLPDLGLMELAHLYSASFKARGGANATKLYKLAGGIGWKAGEQSDLYVRMKTIATGLAARLDRMEREEPGTFLNVEKRFTDTDIMNLAHVDFILRERCSRHNKYEESPGTSCLFGSGRIGLLNGRFDQESYKKTVMGNGNDSSFVEVDKDANDEFMEEEEELLAETGGDFDSYIALKRTAKRLLSEAHLVKKEENAANKAVETYFKEMCMEALAPRSSYTANRFGDVFYTANDAPKPRLIGTDNPEYSVPFNSSRPRPFYEVIPSLFEQVGIGFKTTTEADNPVKKMNLGGVQRSQEILMMLTLYILATGEHETPNELLKMDSDVLTLEEMKVRFPMYKSGDDLYKKNEFTRGTGRQFILPPFYILRDRKGPRASLMEADTASVSSNQHLFREFLRSIPPALVEKKTVIMDNASFHGGLRKDEIAVMQDLCANKQICYIGKDIRAEFSEESRELRSRGAGVGVPTVQNLSTTLERRGGADTITRIRELAKLTQPALLFLPPYCPQLNPIEAVFALVKQVARRVLDRAPQRTRMAVTCGLLRGLDSISTKTLRGEYVHAGYLYSLEKREHTIINPDAFLRRAGILGYITQLIEQRDRARRSTPRVGVLVRERVKDEDKQKQQEDATIQRQADNNTVRVTEFLKTDEISDVASRILRRAFDIKVQRDGLDLADFAAPVNVVEIRANAEPAQVQPPEEKRKKAPAVKKKQAAPKLRAPPRAPSPPPAETPVPFIAKPLPRPVTTRSGRAVASKAERTKFWMTRRSQEAIDNLVREVLRNPDGENKYKIQMNEVLEYYNEKIQGTREERNLPIIKEIREKINQRS